MERCVHPVVVKLYCDIFSEATPTPADGQFQVCHAGSKFIYFFGWKYMEQVLDGVNTSVNTGAHMFRH